MSEIHDLVHEKRRKRDPSEFGAAGAGAEWLTSTKTTVSRFPRVALLIRSLSNGGAELSTVTLANELAKRGNRVELILISARGPLASEVSPDVSVTCFGVRHGALAIGLLARHLWRTRPDVLLANLTASNVTAICADFLSGRRTKVVAIERQRIPASSWPVRRKLMNFLAIPILYRLAFRVIAVSHDLAANVRAYARMRPRDPRVQTIYNPIACDSIRSKAQAGDGHPWLQQTHAPVLVTVCRLAPLKRVDLVLAAFQKVLEQRPVYLLVVGDGPERSRLREQAQRLDVAKRVDFVGFQTNPYPFIAGCAALVSASMVEGLPRNIIEAMCLHVPVVAADCPHGPAEILEHGRWGELVAMNDGDALASAILKALDAPIDGAPRALDFGCERSLEAYQALIAEARAECGRA
jgi:glycosyltransferase involved in cell wall biosynthesis